ncbi:MAG: hypothetical protein EBX80_01695, partial [Acidimicrobiia bacterium]|nr:hypothetical protein [Acidimicrobiia bacterium]
MAISFSKPDPSSPAAVGSAQFNVTRRGFDQGEVRRRDEHGIDKAGVEQGTVVRELGDVPVTAV